MAFWFYLHVHITEWKDDYLANKRIKTFKSKCFDESNTILSKQWNGSQAMSN